MNQIRTTVVFRCDINLTPHRGVFQFSNDQLHLGCEIPEFPQRHPKELLSCHPHSEVAFRPRKPITAAHFDFW
jgi:hypothetical protein